jgi:hypothetical protein
VIKANRWDQPPLIMTSMAANAVLCGNTGQAPASWKVACP